MAVRVAAGTIVAAAAAAAAVDTTGRVPSKLVCCAPTVG